MRCAAVFVVPEDPATQSTVFRVEVATDDGCANVVRQETVIAKAKDDFTARVLMTGLSPATQYYYRFTHAMGAASPVGSFRTAPAPSDGSEVRFVVSGDSNLGYTDPRGLDFHVLSAAAAEDPDFFVFFGDTIHADSGILPGGDAFTLDEYREVHRLTRADPHMQALLAATSGKARFIKPYGELTREISSCEHRWAVGHWSACLAGRGACRASGSIGTGVVSVGWCGAAPDGDRAGASRSQVRGGPS